MGLPHCEASPVWCTIPICMFSPTYGEARHLLIFKSRLALRDECPLGWDCPPLWAVGRDSTSLLCELYVGGLLVVSLPPLMKHVLMTWTWTTERTLRDFPLGLYSCSFCRSAV